jgi:hypothetical protein
MGALTEIRSGVIFLPIRCLSVEIEAIIGPCKQFDSTFNVMLAEDVPKMLGNIPVEGPIREASENSGSPNLRLSDEADKFTNGASAYTRTGIANNITNANQIFVTLFIFSLPQ